MKWNMRMLCAALCLLLAWMPAAAAEAVPANPAAGANGNAGRAVSTAAPAEGKTEDDRINQEILEIEWTRFESLLNGSMPALLTNQNNYKYAELVRQGWKGEGLLKTAEQVMGVQSEASVNDYIDVLSALIMLCRNNIPVSSVQVDSQNWTISYVDKIAEIAMRESIGALGEDYEDVKELCGIGRLSELVNENNMPVLYHEVFDFMRSDQLLAQIEEHSSGKLKEAARTLRGAEGYRFLAELKAFSQAAVEGEAFSLITDEDISVEPILSMLSIASDDSEYEMVRYAFGAIDASLLLMQLGGTSGLAAWELIKDGGSLIAEGAYGLDAFTRRLCELNVLYDIDGALCKIFVEQLNSIDQPDYELMRDTMLTMRCLLYCHMQGESTFYYLLTNEMGVMTVAFDTDEMESWYLKKRQNMHTWETRLNSVMNTHGLLGAVVPLNDPQMDFSRMEVAIEATDGREIARTKLYEDGVYVFHEPNEEYVTIKLYIDGEWTKSLKNVRLDVENDSYVRYDICLFDSPYPAFVKEQVAQYGRSDLGRQKAELSWGMGSEKWPQRRGVAGADVVDLNADGYEELLVYRFVNNGGDTSQPNALRIYLYRTNERGEVEEIGWINLLESRTRAYCSLRAGIAAEEGLEMRIYTERVERAANGYSISYESYVCDGYTVQSEKRVGGSTDYYGGLSMREGSGKSTYLWLGSGQLEEGFSSVSDLGNKAWIGLDSDEAAAEGMEQMGFVPSAYRGHTDEGRIVSFPARLTGDEYAVSFEYFCQGEEFEVKYTWAEDSSMLTDLLKQAEAAEKEE